MTPAVYSLGFSGDNPLLAREQAHLLKGVIHKKGKTVKFECEVQSAGNTRLYKESGTFNIVIVYVCA